MDGRTSHPATAVTASGGWVSIGMTVARSLYRDVIVAVRSTSYKTVLAPSTIRRVLALAPTTVILGERRACLVIQV